MEQMTAEDWIILRLLMAMTRKSSYLLGDEETIRSTHYLVHKYGLDVLFNAVDALNEEK